MWALKLGAVVTSDNRWQWHCQLCWAGSKPSPIAMDMINAIIVGCQSAHETSPSNTMRKIVAISLKATRQPCQQTWQGCHESVVSITTILIPGQQLLSQERQLSWRKHDKHHHEPGGPLNGKPQADWANSCPRSPTTNMGSTTKHAKNNSQAEQKTKPL